MANNEEALEANNADMANRRPRSIECNEKVYLRFVNCTNRCIEVVWINYRGAYKRYMLLRRFSHYIDINTFETHPWVAMDHRTRDVMRIDNEPIYYPRQMITDRPDAADPNLRHPIHPENRRQIRYITLPLYTLRERCLLEIRNHLRTEADVVDLYLPDRLSDDLRKLIAQRQNFIPIS